MVYLHNPNLDGFSHSPSFYAGNQIPKNTAFNIQLQKLAVKIGYISGLEASGQLSADEAYEQVKALWQEFQQYKKGIEVAEKSLQSS